jgi:hypothetical protein
LPSSSVPDGAAGASAPAASVLHGAPPSLLRNALSYAQLGWPVFPAAGIVKGVCGCTIGGGCERPGKHPLTRHGVHDACVDARRIRRWWQRWPGANVALATGAIPALVVIDIDPASGGWDSLASLIDAGYRCPPTATVVTGGGGLHLYFAARREPLRNHVGRLPGIALPLPGIDLRGEGGYVIAPPSIHASGGEYRWIEDSRLLAPAPAWLTEPSRRAEPSALAARARGTPRYGRAALRDELARLRTARKGTRNHTLNRTAFLLGQLVGAGELTVEDVLNPLFDAALGVGLSETEARRTIESGLRAGVGFPRARTSLTSPARKEPSR